VKDQLVIPGDARNLRQLGITPGSVDCIITSPPYFNLKKYASDPEVKGELGQNQDLAEYLDDLARILTNCFEASKASGVLWMVLDTFRQKAARGGLGELIPLPFLISDVARNVGWRLQEVVIWEKNKTLPYSGQGKLRNLIEYVLLFTKTQNFKHRPFRVAERHGTSAEWLSGWPDRYHPLGRRPANIWRIPIPTQGMWSHAEHLHFCPLPQALVARCVELTTDKGDVVFDPFAGIGTVPAQAEAMGRIGRGVELNPAFIEIFDERVLPSFQASWESQADLREMSRRDQLREAEAIMLLRALKGGKELMKLIDRWAHQRVGTGPRAPIESLIVEPPPTFKPFFDVDASSVEKAAINLRIVVGGLDFVEPLTTEIEEALKAPPFSGLGLELSVDVMERQPFLQQLGSRPLFEFEQARRGSFTTLTTPTSGRPLPRLCSTVPLARVVHGDGHSPLEIARKEAERRVLTSELALSDGAADLADRLGLPEAEVHSLLLEHGIDEAQQTFGIPISSSLLPDS
jgi:DNA modification methylase